MKKLFFLLFCSYYCSHAQAIGEPIIRKGKVIMELNLKRKEPVFSWYFFEDSTNKKYDVSCQPYLPDYVYGVTGKLDDFQEFFFISQADYNQKKIYKMVLEGHFWTNKWHYRNNFDFLERNFCNATHTCDEHKVYFGSHTILASYKKIKPKQKNWLNISKPLEYTKELIIED